MEKDSALCKYQQLICNKINVFGSLLLTKLYYSLFTSILPAASICKNVCVAQMHCKDEYKLFKPLITIYMNRTWRHWFSWGNRALSCKKLYKPNQNCYKFDGKQYWKMNKANIQWRISNPLFVFLRDSVKMLPVQNRMKTCMHSVTAR